LTASALLVGLVLGLALPRRVTRFARPKVRRPYLLIGAVGQVVASRLDGNAAVFLAVASLFLLLGFAYANIHLAGMGVVGIGLAANLVGLAVNVGMPVRPKALVAAHVVSADEIEGVSLNGPRHLEGPQDKLLFLTDIIPFRPGHAAISFGDLIITIGLADVVTHLVRRQRRVPRGPEQRQGTDEDSSNSASPDHDWGTAPSDAPSSGSQNSARPEAMVPRTTPSATGEPA
jgi:hypothetical protein